MPTQPAIAQALRDVGLTVVETPGWLTRGASRFAPIGLLVHHTGPYSSIKSMVALLIKGRADLPGPLCQIGLDQHGTCHIIAAGRGNHAGEGSWLGRTGNVYFAGIEAFHPGDASPWPPAQLDAYHRAAAALCRLWGFRSEMVAGHKEYAPRRKIDPKGIDMPTFRAAVQRWLDEWAEAEEPEDLPQPAPTFLTLSEGVESVKHSQHFVGLTAALDQEGRGWVDIPHSMDRVFDVTGQGSDPPREGYWSPLVVTMQPQGEKTRVSVFGSPGQHAGLYWKLAEA